MLLLYNPKLMRDSLLIKVTVQCIHVCQQLSHLDFTFAALSQKTDYLLHKEKQLPTQLMDKWQKAALAVSYASVFTTFVIGVSAFGT